MSRQPIDMTTGSIPSNILRFALPVFFGQLFQQLYNVVDSLVVGNVEGSAALAAVGSSGSLIFVLVGLVTGLFIGAGVVTSRYVGAKDEENISRSVHTTLTIGLLAGILFSVIGVLMCPIMLDLMDTPAEVLPSSLAYLRIYFSGLWAMALYNAANSICNAVGDSRHPLYYLLISSATNVVLDLLFVAVLGFGVRGAAVATVISQAFSAALNLARLARVKDPWRLDIRKLGIDPVLGKEVLRLGVPAGLQNAIISIANVFVQSNINAFGANAMAGSAAYMKIEGFGFLPVTSFSMSMSTYIGQNLGAGLYDRARKGARFGIVCCVSLAELVGIGIWLLSPVLISAFDRTPEVIQFGVNHARTVTLFYFLLAYSHTMAGILRGAGKSIVPMLVMMCCWCILRITYLVIAVPLANSLHTVFLCYPITWTLSFIAFTVYYFKGNWIHGFDQKTV